MLASRLRHEPLKEWTEWELTGYPSEDALPDYRRGIPATVLATFSGPFGSGLKNARLPQFAVDEEHREWLFYVSFLPGVAELEEMGATGEGGVRFPWPPDIVAYYAERFYEHMACLTADRVVSTSVVRGILDTIRTRVLTFALEIEEAAPSAGEDNTATVPPERVNQIFKTYIYGGQANLAAAARDSVQIIGSLPETWSLLRQELLELGLGEAELADLEAAVRADTSRGAAMGEQTQGWLGRMTSRIASGATTIGTETTAEVLGGVLLRHLGG